MYSQNNAAMAPPQKPETFMLSDAAQQSLPQDAQVALQQVDNREYIWMQLTLPRPHGQEPFRSRRVLMELDSQILPDIGARGLDT